jgi:hypothetical protein
MIKVMIQSLQCSSLSGVILNSNDVFFGLVITVSAGDASQHGCKTLVSYQIEDVL